jgi:hypothetical protein
MLRPLLAIALLLAAFAWWQVFEGPEGGDFQIYCAALQALDAGENVYDVRVLSGAGAPDGLPFTNPALILPILRPVCATGWYFAVWVGLIIATTVLIGALDKNRDWLLLTAIVASGFDATSWMLRTGNIAVAETMLCGIAVVAVYWGRLPAFSLAIGLAAFLKAMPAVFALLAFSNHGVKLAVSAGLNALATFGALHLLFFILLPAEFAAFWSAMQSGFGGFLQAEVIHGGVFHPSMLSLAAQISVTVTGRSWPSIPVYAAVAMLIMADLLYMTMRRRHRSLVPLWAVGLLAIMPRLKPYAFGLALVPVYLGAKTLGLRPRTLVILAACLVPFLTYVPQPHGNGILAYGQLFGLLGTYVVFRVSNLRRSEALYSDVETVQS